MRRLTFNSEFRTRKWSETPHVGCYGSGGGGTRADGCRLRQRLLRDDPVRHLQALDELRQDRGGRRLGDGQFIQVFKHPEVPRGFKTPLVPVVATLGILVCGAMIFGLGWTNWARLGGWLLIGLLIYFGYSRYHSKLRNPGK